MKCSNKFLIKKNTASMVHSLIDALDLTGKLNIVYSKVAKEEELRAFHSEDYIQFLKFSQEINENFDEEDNFGLGFDCPIFEELWEVVQEIGGASLIAADTLINDVSKIAINWCGGWHHAQRDSASGFCYVNDIVLAIQRLRTKFNKVLYIDLDVHHGDGVENAFLFSHKVLTLSFHQQEPGFFPGTGKSIDIGLGRGRHFTINVPYKSGINNKQFIYLFESVIYDIFSSFKPDAIVCQTGADALASDPMGSANLTIEGYQTCVQHVLNLHKPTLFLGGGGYNKMNTAKLWAAITCTILGINLPEEIPEHPFFSMYGPDFLLEISPSLRKSENSPHSLDESVIGVIKSLILMESTNEELKEQLRHRIKAIDKSEI